MPTQAGSLFDGIRDFLDFESWAPKSSQAWRLGNNLSELRRAKQGENAADITEKDVDVLNERLAAARGRGGGTTVAASDAASSSSSATDETTPSFLQSTDDEVAAALAGRISQVASGATRVDPRDDRASLTGPLLRELMETKWGKAYDLSFVRRDLPLGKTLICLNVMWTHIEQRSFPMSEEEYEEKLDLVALYLNSWGQADRVESFLRQPPRPRKGMPSKPIMGTAISIQLDPDDAVIDEFFSQGGA